ncbi:MAG: hypothetical protein ABIK73_01345 [candidate division WOR-3 bacterium]
MTTITKYIRKKLSTSIQLIEQTCSTNLTAPVQSIEQHNNKQNINNKQRAIYKKELRRIASWENNKENGLKNFFREILKIYEPKGDWPDRNSRCIRALDKCDFLKYAVIDCGDTNFLVRILFFNPKKE